MKRYGIHQAISGALTALVVGLVPVQSVDACTRILWNDNELAVLVGRTMDWPESTEPILTVLPRGMQRNGDRVGSETVINDNPAMWTSKYGSLVTTVYGIGAVDGFNERGLAGHLLYLNDTDFGTRDSIKPGLHAGLWLQFVLDNAATVEEALALLETVQIVMVEARGHEANVQHSKTRVVTPQSSNTLMADQSYIMGANTRS